MPEQSLANTFFSVRHITTFLHLGALDRTSAPGFRNPFKQWNHTHTHTQIQTRKTWYWTSHKMDTCFQCESWSKKAVSTCTLGNFRFLAAVHVPEWLTTKVPRELTWGFTNKFWLVEKSASTESTNNKDGLYFWKPVVYTCSQRREWKKRSPEPWQEPAFWGLAAAARAVQGKVEKNSHTEESVSVLLVHLLRGCQR